MVLPMSRPWKHPSSGIYWLRKRVPDDLRAIVGKTEERRSLRTRDPEQAKILNAEALVAVEATWAAARAGAAVTATNTEQDTTLQSKSLTERDAHEHARWIYTQWIHRHRDYPSKQTFWRVHLFDHLWSDLPEGPSSQCEPVPTIDWLTISKMKQKCWDEADLLAVAHDWVLDEASRMRLAKALGEALQRASLSLARQAGGENVELDGSERLDPAAGRPEVLFEDLMLGWGAERRPAPKTVYEWRRAVTQFATHLGHGDAAKVTADDVLKWKGAMVAEGLRPKTIRDAKLAPIRTVLQWAVDTAGFHRTQPQASQSKSGAGRVKAYAVSPTTKPSSF